MNDDDYTLGMQRDDPTLSTSDLIAMYEGGITDLRAAVAGLTPEQLLARPVPGKWSTLEVVAHLADTELYFTDRILRTLAMERPLLVSVDERPYAERFQYQTLDFAEELDLITALRRHAARILRLQPAEAWKRAGIHSQTGLLTVRQLVLQAVRHLRHHLPFLAEKRKATRA